MAVRDPDKTGVAKAWKIEPTDEAIRQHVESWGHAPTPVRTWYVNGPYHPLWSWWMVGVISLADVPGVPPAIKQYPEAEYEFTIYSLSGVPNIEALDRGDLANRGFDAILQPADVTFHFHGVNDRQAAEICDAAVAAICAGQSCDRDFREWWKGALTSTVTHYALGVHE